MTAKPTIFCLLSPLKYTVKTLKCLSILLQNWSLTICSFLSFFSSQRVSNPPQSLKYTLSSQSNPKRVFSPIPKTNKHPSSALPRLQPFHCFEGPPGRPRADAPLAAEYGRGEGFGREDQPYRAEWGDVVAREGGEFCVCVFFWSKCFWFFTEFCQGSCCVFCLVPFFRISNISCAFETLPWFFFKRQWSRSSSLARGGPALVPSASQELGDSHRDQAGLLGWNGEAAFLHLVLWWTVSQFRKIFLERLETTN